MATRTKFVFLMHPKEFKKEKAGTGRLTHLCLPESEIHMGMEFETHSEVRALLADPANHCVLLYPGPTARNLSRGELRPEELGGRRLVVFLLDATWACARKMLRISPCLQTIPRIMFTPGSPSRFVIKQQPQEGCLSTLEATHETLLALERSGLDAYPDPGQLLTLFDRMQAYQIGCALNPELGGYRRKPYSAPGERTGPRGRSATRRQSYLGNAGASFANDSGAVITAACAAVSPAPDAA
jgi:DTW domain-containing protein YfiP